MKKTIDKINKVSSDLTYLADEYSDNLLWGNSRADGAVEFESLLEWLTKNKHTVMHMINTVDLIAALEKAD